MKLNSLIFLLCVFLFTHITPTAYSQHNNYQALLSSEGVEKAIAEYINSDLPESNAELCFHLGTSNEKNIFVINLNLLGERFDKVYFMKYSFYENILVNIYYSNDGYAAYQADINHPIDTIKEIFIDLQWKTRDKSASMSPGERDEWLKHQDKYLNKH